MQCKRKAIFSLLTAFLEVHYLVSGGRKKPYSFVQLDERASEPGRAFYCKMSGSQGLVFLHDFEGWNWSVHMASKLIKLNWIAEYKVGRSYAFSKWLCRFQCALRNSFFHSFSVLFFSIYWCGIDEWPNWSTTIIDQALDNNLFGSLNNYI